MDEIGIQLEKVRNKMLEEEGRLGGYGYGKYSESFLSLER